MVIFDINFFVSVLVNTEVKVNSETISNQHDEVKKKEYKFSSSDNCVGVTIAVASS